MKNGPYELVIAPDEYPGKKYRGRYCYEHHLVYWQETGKLLKSGQLIHHKNDSKRQNKLSNFEVISRADHTRLHNKGRGKGPIQWECEQCHTLFKRRRNGNTHRFCSRKCIGLYNFPARNSRKVVKVVG